MGAKAKPSAKKKDGNPESGGELTPEEKAKLFMLTCQSLQVQLCKITCCHHYINVVMVRFIVLYS
jgi:hypothetical protein